MSLSDPFLDPDSLERAASEHSEAASKEDAVDFQIRFFAQILERSPDYVDVLRCQGELLSRKQRRAEALAVDQRLARLCPRDCVVLYNLACSLALEHRSLEAIAALRLAFAQGYNDLEHLEHDGDLDSVRSLPGYLALMQEHGIAR